MAKIFPKWTNRLPIYLAGASIALALLATFGVWYYFSPEFTEVGYRPRQPVPFSHKLHVGELQMDCRYCHTTVEVSAVASVPPTQICMNCHQLVARDSEKLKLVRESLETEQPIAWIRVHKVPEYAYFNHTIHINAGIGCSSCHGDVAQMDKIMQVEPLSMSWCLECHRNPDLHLRPEREITNPAWSPPRNQLAVARQIKEERDIYPSTDCTACHR
ncbi:cytochrome c3 family protein [Acidobacteria bacterium AH-259-D05]|nr:cytochrome c3 family protein [Acidobacteria bacterium AH-259-D05]